MDVNIMMYTITPLLALQLLLGSAWTNKGGGEASLRCSDNVESVSRCCCGSLVVFLFSASPSSFLLHLLLPCVCVCVCVCLWAWQQRATTLPLDYSVP